MASSSLASIDTTNGSTSSPIQHDQLDRQTAMHNSTSNEDHEQRFALDSVERDAGRVWSTLPEKYCLDKDFVLAALKSKSLPAKSEFERTFPQSLRFDRDVVLAFTERDDFAEIYFSRHLFVPECLTGDKEVMMAYCRKVPRALQECSEELCNDRDVVMAAIGYGGLELQYASRRLQEDKDIVIAACQKDGRALEFCPPGPTRTELTSNRDFMLDVLGKNGGSMLRLVPESLKRDPILLLEALAHGMRFRQVPECFKNDKEFLLQAISRKSSLYLDIAPFHRDVDFALAAIQAPDSADDVHRRALQIAPQLKRNRNVVMAIALRGDKDLLESLFNNGEARQFLDDKPLMLAAVKRDCRLFKYCARLREDPDIIMASIQQESAIDILRDISPETRRRYPEISIKAISVTCSRRLRYLESLIPEGLWQNREVVLTWIRKGGSVLEQFERSLERDEEMALAVAEHNWSSFKKVGNAFRSDKGFMAKAVQKEGRVLRFASRPIQNDFQIVVRAVANHHRAMSGAMVSEKAFKTWVKNALDLHMTFVKDFLRGIAINKPHVPPAFRSQLPMLDRGVETSQAFKQLIAEYLGVPVKEELRMMRQAWTNLTYPPCNSRMDSDIEDTAEEEIANILGVRRRERWERRVELDRAMAGADRDGRPQERERRDRFRRAAFRDQVVAARRRHGPPEADQIIDLWDDDDEDDDPMVVEPVQAVNPGLFGAPFFFGAPPRNDANPRNNNNNNDANPDNRNRDNNNVNNNPDNNPMRDHFFAMLERWGDL